VLRGAAHLDLELGLLVDLNLQIINHTIDAWTPFVERPHGILEGGQAMSKCVNIRGDLSLELIDAGPKPLVDLVEQQLGL
jgi:hypothetical protein